MTSYQTKKDNYLSIDLYKISSSEDHFKAPVSKERTASKYQFGANFNSSYTSNFSGTNYINDILVGAFKRYSGNSTPESSRGPTTNSSKMCGGVCRDCGRCPTL